MPLKTYCLRAFGPALILFAIAGQAADNDWVNPQSGLWRTAASWSAGQPPNTNFAQISVTNSHTKIITVDGGTADDNLFINQFTISSPGGETNILSLANVGSNRPLRVLNPFTVGPGGRVEVTTSALRVGGGILGQLVISNGSVQINSGLIETTGTIMHVGQGASGQLTINGGTVLVGTNLQVGAGTNGNGRVVLNNGTLNVLRRLDVADDAFSTGAVVVAGGTLLATNTLLTASVGDEGKGSLAISNGTVQLGELVVGRRNRSSGTVILRAGTLEILRRLTVGQDRGATGAVEMAGGELIATDAVVGARIGDQGVGSLTLSDGLLRLADASVGRSTNGFGTLTMFGGTIRSDDISIGREGATGAVFVAGGSFLLGTDVFRIGRENVGAMTVSGGEVQARSMFVGLEGGAKGSLTVSGGLTLLSSNLLAGQMTFSTNFPTGMSNSTGTVLQTGGTTFITNSTCSGTLEMRFGTGALRGGTSVVDQLVLTNVEGTFAFTGGRLELKGATVNNGRWFPVGNGEDAAVLYLRGGTNTFYPGLEVTANSRLAGAGLINGSVVNRGQITADGLDEILIFTGPVTNYGTMRATNGGRFEFRGPIINLGSLAPVITSVHLTPTQFQISFTTDNGIQYSLQEALNLTAHQWTNRTTITGNGAIMTIPVARPTAPPRFYRIFKH